MNQKVMYYTKIIQENIRAELALRGFTDKDTSVMTFSKLMGLSKTRAWELMNFDDWNPTLLTLIKISDSLDITLENLLRN